LGCWQIERLTEALDVFVRSLISGEHPGGVAHVADLHREPQPVCTSSSLANDGQVGFVERVVAD
jgi:hypothetical protein